MGFPAWDRCHSSAESSQPPAVCTTPAIVALGFLHFTRGHENHSRDRHGRRSTRRGWDGLGDRLTRGGMRNDGN